jgi:hypothetical protein
MSTFAGHRGTGMVPPVHSPILQLYAVKGIVKYVRKANNKNESKRQIIRAIFCSFEPIKDTNKSIQICLLEIVVANRKPNTHKGIAEVIISVALVIGDLKMLFAIASATVKIIISTKAIDPIAVRTLFERLRIFCI